MGENMAMTDKQRAAQDLAEKLRFEEELSLDVVRLFERVAEEFRQSMLESGVPPTFDGWQSFFEEMLTSHYQVVGDVFLHRTSDQLDLELSEEEKNIILAAFSLYSINQASSSAEFINETNRNQAREAVEAARAQERVDVDNGGQRYDPTTMAAVATNAFRVKLFGRVTSIATTETQRAAEASKQVESEVLHFKKPTINDTVAPPITEDIGSKTWISILDNVTRETHVKADSQTVKYNAFFIVGGFKLKFPGDRNNGAPIEEWINCRCCAIYTPTPEVIRLRTKR